jgi:hypothetical protein
MLNFFKKLWIKPRPIAVVGYDEIPPDAKRCLFIHRKNPRQNGIAKIFTENGETMVKFSNGDLQNLDLAKKEEINGKIEFSTGPFLQWKVEMGEDCMLPLIYNQEDTYTYLYCSGGKFFVGTYEEVINFRLNKLLQNKPD